MGDGWVGVTPACLLDAFTNAAQGGLTLSEEAEESQRAARTGTSSPSHAQPSETHEMRCTKTHSGPASTRS